MIIFNFTKAICKFLPPLIAGYFREVFYPFKKAINDNISFSRKSVTGSVYFGNTQDLHSYWFSIHGFFDWRNLLIAKSITEFFNYSEIIEIGANIGTETIGFSDIIGNKGFVHAFEPFPANIEELTRIKNNSLVNNIIIYPIAVSNKKGIVEFLAPPENLSGIGKIKTDNQTVNERIIKVEVQLLDDSIDKFKSVSAIFIDTEGHEMLVLAGASQTIQKYRPVVILEVSDSLLAEYNHCSMDILVFFKTLDYSCYNIGRFLINKVNDENLDRFNRHTNWICLPDKSDEVISSIKKRLYKHIVLPLRKI